MAEIRVNVTASKSQRVNVSSSNIATEITATPDTSQYYSNLAKNWAIAENIVDGKDYSSKHYAKEAQQASALANTYKEATEQAYISFSEQYANAETELTAIKDAGVQEINTVVTDGKTEITTTKDLAINAVNNTKTTILQDIEFVADGEKKEIEDLIDNGKEELKESLGDVKVLTTLEIGDIGFTQMAIDESKGKRRVLNGQLIIQDQYVQFTNIIKNSVALNPDLACTESEWQTAVTMSTNGVCEKFVIDDNAGTIRLPKYPQYLDLTNNASAKTQTVSIKGNGMTLGLTNGGGNFGVDKFLNNSSLLGNPNAYGKAIGSSVTDAGIQSKTTIGVTTDATKSGITGSVTVPAVTSEKIKGQYFIQVATGAETEDNIINEIELNNPFSLLDYKFSEYELNNLSWLRSNGQYNSKAVYPAVYDLLLKIYNGTETKAGVSVKLTTETFTDYDFVLNTAEETFRLPIKVKLASGKAVVGNGKALVGLQNLTAPSISKPEFYFGKAGSNVDTIAIWNSAQTSSAVGITTDATKSGIETSDSDLYLYFYVGETVQNANLINAGRIEEKVTDIRAELPHKLNDKQITNCLLEVPQRIKLELNNGVLTLKAGSVVTVPNGKNADGSLKFDYLETSKDTSTTSSNNDTWVIWLYSDGNLGARGLASQTGSGETTPSNVHCLYYNTKDNKIYNVSPEGISPADCSFPVGIVTATTNGITQINQVFNGMGYIGSTIWVDKGVKGLIPNGRNEDGTLKNIELTTTEIKLRNDATSAINKKLVLYQNKYLGLGNGFISCKSYADRNTSISYQYVEETNNTYVTTRTYVEPFCVLANITCDGTNVVSLQPKQPFRALDYNDKQEIISWGMPDYSTIITGLSKPFTAPTDGLISWNNGGTGNCTINGNTFYIAGNDASNEGNVTLFLSKNDVISFTNDAGTPCFVSLKGAN